MNLTNLGEIIAERNLNLVGDRQGKVIIRIGKPKIFPDSCDYYCPYQIIGLGKEKIIAILFSMRYSFRSPPAPLKKGGAAQSPRNLAGDLGGSSMYLTRQRNAIDTLEALIAFKLFY